VKSVDAIIAECQQIWHCADAEGRDLFAHERDQVERLLGEAKAVRQLEGGLTWDRGGRAGGPGDQFISSEGYKGLMAKGLTAGPWSSGEVALNTKSTLLSTPGTALTPAGYVPGITQSLFQRLYVSDLLPQQQAPGNPVRFVSETTATNAAAATAEGAAKPESALAFGETSEPVRKIATYLPVSDELLEDAPQIAAYLNQRLGLFVQIQEETQLLLGDGTAPNLQGFVASGRSIGTYARGTVDDNALALFKAANGTRGSSHLEPDTVVIHPTNWQAIRTAKDSSGQYYGGGPFYGPYGGPQGPASSSQFSTAEQLWGMRVVVTSSITVGSALIGAFGTGAAIHRKGGMKVEATNSHSTFFATNITAIRAEERLALCVYRPTAFCVVKDLT
jgi:HK97 family phage major capsid protein